MINRNYHLNQILFLQRKGKYVRRSCRGINIEEFGGVGSSYYVSTIINIKKNRIFSGYKNVWQI